MNFLTKIKKQEKLELVQPSEDICKSYLNKSETNLISAKILLKNKMFEEATALIYYSMYNISIALLFRVGIKCENHTATIIILKSIFNIENKEIKKSKKERIDKQDYFDFKITEDDVINGIKEAEQFNKKMFDIIMKLKREEIQNYRDIFKKL